MVIHISHDRLYKKKKLLQTCKPDPVSAKGGWLSFICFAGYPAKSICLPANIGRAALKRWPMWHFSMQGLPGTVITYRTCELLPHIFTLIPPWGRTVIFCGTVSYPLLTVTGSRLFTGALLCAVRTFLLQLFMKSITRFVATVKLIFYLRG